MNARVSATDGQTLRPRFLSNCFAFLQGARIDGPDHENHVDIRWVTRARLENKTIRPRAFVRPWSVPKSF